MKIAIVGWGVEGQSTYKYYGPDHEYLIVNEEPRNDFPAQSSKVKVQYIDKPRQIGVTSNVSDLSYLDGIKDCDKIVITPTSRKNLEKIYDSNDDIWQKVTTNLEIFFQDSPTKNTIGITGTKGKGTTSTLTYRMLKAAGLNAYLAGNIGLSPLDFLHELKPTDWVVLEISNFQLYSLDISPHIAVCLMVVPEHLDWHPDYQEYLETKGNIFKFQKPNDIAIYFEGNKDVQHIAGYSPGAKIPYYDFPGARVQADGTITVGQDEIAVINRRDVGLLGEHNLQNICAALTAVWQVTQNTEAFANVIKNFTGLEHRLEFVREFNGVRYYDDSFGTTPETAIVAMQSFVEPLVVIMGGSDKGADLNPMTDEVIKDRVSTAILIGSTADAIEKQLREKGFTNIITGLKTMPEIVKAAQKAAKPGTIVLLSTGCASFGLFKDYKDRGNQFKSAVLKLS